MSALAIGGRAVTLCTITFPLAGAWTADVDVDTDEDITGRASIVCDGGPTWAGAVVSGGVTHGLWRGRLVGGAGGLRSTLDPLAYRSATLADVLRDALSEGGETLSTASGSLASSAALWHRARGTAAATVAAVAGAAGYGWRVLADGSVWLGTETWPDAADLDVTLLDRDPRGGIYTLSGDTLTITPGTLLQVRDETGAVFVRVGDVRHVVEPERITTTVWTST